MSDKPKWRIRKSNGAWIVRKPNGSHFGAYYTHAEALAQATHRKSVATAGGGGYFERDTGSASSSCRLTNRKSWSRWTRCTMRATRRGTASTCLSEKLLT